MNSTSPGPYARPPSLNGAAAIATAGPLKPMMWWSASRTRPTANSSPPALAAAPPINNVCGSSIANVRPPYWTGCHGSAPKSPIVY